jgi:hypothetical protein
MLSNLTDAIAVAVEEWSGEERKIVLLLFKSCF